MKYTGGNISIAFWLIYNSRIVRAVYEIYWRDGGTEGQRDRDLWRREPATAHSEDPFAKHKQQTNYTIKQA